MIMNDQAETPSSTELQSRIDKALDYALNAVFDGAHHKSWVIDQMVRALTGCPPTQQTATDAYGKPYTLEAQGESTGYIVFIERASNGDPAYAWDPGIPL